MLIFVKGGRTVDAFCIACIRVHGDGCPFDNNVWCSKNLTVVKYWSASGLEGRQYLMTDFVDVVPM